MGVLGKLEISPELLPCDRCRGGRLSQNADLHTGYVRVDLASESSDGVELKCAVDVTEIEIRNSAYGVYDAFAVAEVPCPLCRDVHVVKKLLAQSSTLLRQLTACSACGRSLEPLEQHAKFRDSGEAGGVLTVRGRLQCQRCLPPSNVVRDLRFRSSEHVYDVFLSYSKTERQVVEHFAVALRAAGFNPFWDQWHVKPGDPIQESLESGLQASIATIVFIGPSGIGPWQNEELRSALQVRITDQQHRVIPVILPGVTSVDEVPVFLRRLSWIDLRRYERADEGLSVLISAIRNAMSGGRTDAPPAT